MKGDLSAGRDTDRHERQIARPKRLKRDDEEDDGPTYVVEESNDTLTKAEYEALVNGGTVEQAESSADASQNTVEKKDGDGPAKQKQQQPAASLGGASKKRKAVKIGGEADEEDGKDDGATAGKAEAQQKKEVKPKKLKKKAKAVKLSFGDDEEEKT
ncbi:uncharacterized protein LTHEOB_1089 [Neofusicoccum parvum]|nr:uncharacterized protein LTHEOB_1089 [Neofusicoccum parvum]